MELRHLSTFRVVAQLQSFRRAVEALGYVQGNVTPYHQITQAALLPVAYTLGTDFKLAPRASAEHVIHWDQW